LIWIETSAYGGNFINYDADDFDEIALIKNENINLVTERVIALYNRVGGSFLKEHVIVNNTATFNKNEFVNRLECEKFNDDEQLDILAADTDGDVMIYEYFPEVDEFGLTWSYRLPVKNAYYLTSGDFTGDGNIDFCVGGYNVNHTDPSRNYSHFEFFTYSQTEEDFLPLGRLQFDQVQDKNSISSADLDGDGDLELVFSLPPNIYTIDHIDGKFLPTWKGSATGSYNNAAIAVSQTAPEISYFILNQPNGDEDISIVYKTSESVAGPPTPMNFTARALNDAAITLNWEYGSSVDYFNIYRRIDDNTILLDSTSNLQYLDTELETNLEYSYRITAVFSDMDPAESLPTLWKSAIPARIPELESVEMLSLNSLSLSFDLPLSNQAGFVNHYHVNNGIGIPSSANLNSEYRVVILTFSDRFDNYNDYQISLSGLEGRTGVPVADGTYNIDFKEDTTAPEIVEANVLPNKYQIEIVFSESMISSEIEDLSNYTLVLPILDQDNQIITAEYREDSSGCNSLITMQEELKYSSQRYFLKLGEVHDISDNRISNQGNKCRFSLTDIDNLDYLIVYPNPLNLNELAPGGEVGFKFINLPLGQKARNSPVCQKQV